MARSSSSSSLPQRESASCLDSTTYPKKPTCCKSVAQHFTPEHKLHTQYFIFRLSFSHLSVSFTIIYPQAIASPSALLNFHLQTHRKTHNEVLCRSSPAPPYLPHPTLRIFVRPIHPTPAAIPTNILLCVSPANPLPLQPPHPSLPPARQPTSPSQSSLSAQRQPAFSLPPRPLLLSTAAGASSRC